MTRPLELPRINPFATRFVRPGAIPFFFRLGESAAELCRQLAALGWWGEVIGPEGSGKSTLLAALSSELLLQGATLLQVRLCMEARQLDSTIWPALALARPLVLIVDGYEQASWWARRRLQRACRKGQHGLLVTAHQPTGLPLLYRTEATPDIGRAVVAHLLGGEPWPEEIDYSGLLKHHRGSLREVLFEMYDRWELCPDDGRGRLTASRVAAARS
jgi:hypothetical protein